MESWPPYLVTTRNTSARSDNKIHDDREAKRYGFKGGLVPGTALYAHLTRPIVARHGAAWLERNSGELALLKPAYEGERLEITVQEDAPGRDHPAHRASIADSKQTLLATLDTAMPGHLAAPDPWSRIVPERTEAPRIPIGWDAVKVGEPLRALAWGQTVAQQEEWCAGVSDDLPIYRGAGAPVHPGLILQAANRALGNHYVLAPWIHVGSRILTRRALRIGQTAEVRATPIERWEKKGHQFFKVYVALVVDDEALAEIWHTAIFTVRLAA
jgi:hypothetical protein